MADDSLGSSWIELIRSVVLRMPERFALHDLDVHFDAFRRAYPNNKNIDAKVRQVLQVLRDQGTVIFLGNGLYRRIEERPAPTIDIDFLAVAQFKSASQTARVALETWARLNLWCHNCGNPNLLTLPPGTPVSDLKCVACEMEYQVKSLNGRFGPMLTGAAYQPLYERAMAHTVPDFMLIEYNLKRSQVSHVGLIRGSDLTPDRIIRRKELAPTARRAGWVGCNVYIDQLPQIPIVRPAFVHV
jgi:Dam-replacing family/Dam-replacing HTH domain